MKKINTPTKEKIFTEAMISGFAGGNQLPEEDGDLSNTRITAIKANVKESSKVFFQRLNEELHLEVKKRGVIQQLENEIERITYSNKKFILMIEESQNLDIDILKTLKLLRESIHRKSDNKRVFGIVLIGDMKVLYESLKPHRDLEGRLVKFSGLRIL